MGGSDVHSLAKRIADQITLDQRYRWPKIIDILGSTAKDMLSWMLRVRMFKLA